MNDFANDDSGFRVLGSDPVFEGSRIDVDRVRVEGPEGEEFEREIVRHPGAVAIVPVTASRSVLLVRQYRSAIERRLLEIPAGTRDVDEEIPERTALRELEEELGYTAHTIVELGRVWNSPGFCDEETILYLATDLEETSPRRDGVEEMHIEAVEVALDEVEALLVSEGAVVDLQTLAGIQLARAALESL